MTTSNANPLIHNVPLTPLTDAQVMETLPEVLRTLLRGWKEFRVDDGGCRAALLDLARQLTAATERAERADRLYAQLCEAIGYPEPIGQGDATPCEWAATLRAERERLCEAARDLCEVADDSDARVRLRALLAAPTNESEVGE